MGAITVFIMPTITINILDSNGNVIDTREIDESSLAVYQQYYNVQTLDSQPITQTTITTEAQTIINDLENNKYDFPSWFNNTINWVKSGQIPSEDFINSFNSQIQAGNISVKQDEEKIWIYHIYQDGTYRRLHVTQSFIDIQTERGWIFSLTEPTQTPTPTPEPTPTQETFDIVEYTLVDGSVVQRLKYNVLQSYLNDLDSNNIMWKIQGAGYTNNEVWDFYNYIPPTEPEEPDSKINFPMVSQLGVEFSLKNNRVTGRVVLNKITSNWNPYYNDINLISYFELRTPNGIPISSLGQIKQNIVKFPPSQPPLLPTQELTFDESAVDYKALQVKIYLWTEDNIAVAEPLVFTVKEDSVPIDVVNPADNRIQRDDWLAKSVGIFGGLLGISLLLTGNKKLS